MTVRNHHSEDPKNLDLTFLLLLATTILSFRHIIIQQLFSVNFTNCRGMFNIRKGQIYIYILL